MPNTREKLIELLSQVQYLGGLEEKIADHLIANGVTVQKHGRWEIVDFAGSVKCPVCGEVRAKDNYCSNCGAIMDLPNITEQTQSALDAMDRKAHGGE